MKTRTIVLSLLAIFALSFSGCNYTMKSMKTSNNYVEFQKDDFTFSEQLTGEGTQTRILGIDWAHLFKSETASIVEANAFNIPVIGNLPMGGSQAFAINDLMQKNSGYDVVFYPQYETQMTGIPMLYQKTRTVVKARLAKIK
ncbi:MAG TPA: hypothetical protein PLL66_00195 [Bacteroidales bacterium]|nr:hypothetical protein [Bacteroidales bacterium]